MLPSIRRLWHSATTAFNPNTRRQLFHARLRVPEIETFSAGMSSPQKRSSLYTTNFILCCGAHPHCLIHNRNNDSSPTVWLSARIIGAPRTASTSFSSWLHLGERRQVARREKRGQRPPAFMRSCAEGARRAGSGNQTLLTLLLLLLMQAKLAVAVATGVFSVAVVVADEGHNNCSCCSCR